MKNIINQLIEMIKDAKEDAEEGVRDCEGRDSDIYQGWVEALNFVQTSIDGLLLDKPERRKSDRRVKRLSLPFEDRRRILMNRRDDGYQESLYSVSDETQSALNKIADSYLRANNPKGLNGLFSFAKVIDLESENEESFNIYHVRISYGRQDDCFDQKYQKVIKVRTDNLEVVK